MAVTRVSIEASLPEYAYPPPHRSENKHRGISPPAHRGETCSAAGSEPHWPGGCQIRSWTSKWANRGWNVWADGPRRSARDERAEWLFPQRLWDDCSTRRRQRRQISASPRRRAIGSAEVHPRGQPSRKQRTWQETWWNCATSSRLAESVLPHQRRQDKTSGSKVREWKKGPTGEFEYWANRGRWGGVNLRWGLDPSVGPLQTTL